MSRRTLSSQAAQKCLGKGMSRHRGHPRATLSSSTPLQSRQKALLRQHFAKFHHSHPERTTLYILNDQPHNHLPTNAVIANPVIQNDKRRHCEPGHSERQTPSSRTRSFRTTNAVIANPVIQNDKHRHREPGHPERQTPSSQTWSSRTTNPVIPNPVIMNYTPRNPE